MVILMPCGFFCIFVAERGDIKVIFFARDGLLCNL